MFVGLFGCRCFVCLGLFDRRLGWLFRCVSLCVRCWSACVSVYAFLMFLFVVLFVRLLWLGWLISIWFFGWFVRSFVCLVVQLLV